MSGLSHPANNRKLPPTRILKWKFTLAHCSLDFATDDHSELLLTCVPHKGGITFELSVWTWDWVFVWRESGVPGLADFGSLNETFLGAYLCFGVDGSDWQNVDTAPRERSRKGRLTSSRYKRYVRAKHQVERFVAQAYSFKDPPKYYGRTWRRKEIREQLRQIVAWRNEHDRNR